VCIALEVSGSIRWRVVSVALADLNTPAGKVHSSLEHLQESWARVQETWHDASNRAFEENHLLPLALTVKLSLDAVNRMSEILRDAERACADEREGFERF